MNYLSKGNLLVMMREGEREREREREGGGRGGREGEREREGGGREGGRTKLISVNKLIVDFTDYPFTFTPFYFPFPSPRPGVCEDVPIHVPVVCHARATAA